jgi:hypothetical protein
MPVIGQGPYLLQRSSSSLQVAPGPLASSFDVIESNAEQAHSAASQFPQTEAQAVSRISLAPVQQASKNSLAQRKAGTEFVPPTKLVKQNKRVVATAKADKINLKSIQPGKLQQLFLNNAPLPYFHARPWKVSNTDEKLKKESSRIVCDCQCVHDQSSIAYSVQIV